MRPIIGLAALGGVVAVGGYLAMTQYVDAVETPPYAVLEQDDDIEIRRYEPQIVAEYTSTGPRREAASAAFRPLANYIFAKGVEERADTKISMTAPVTQTPQTDTGPIAMTAPVTQSAADGAADDAWTVRFIMPAEYTMETLPTPANPAVRLVEEPETTMLAIRFSGVARDDRVARHERKLRDWAAAKGLTLVEPPTYAYYNAPFTPGFLRRNEVLFEVAPGE
ncbi:MAG: heme-binding protein [Pseudomonadota bacterium]